MEKKKIILMLFLCSTQLIAFDERRYGELMSGESMDLKGADLEGAVIKYVNLNNIDFSGANLENAQFDTVFLRNAIFNKTNLKGARISNTVFTDDTIVNNTRFENAIFDNVTFDHVTITKSSFNFATISNTSFINSTIRKSSMNDIVAGYRIYFIYCTLNKVDFIRLRIQGLIISGLDEMGIELNFETAQIYQGLFLGRGTQSFLRRSNFMGACLESCFLLNIVFENSKGLEKAAISSRSLFKNVIFTNPDEVAALIKGGSKINGKYDGAYKIDWEDESIVIRHLLTTLGRDVVARAAQAADLSLVSLGIKDSSR